MSTPNISLASAGAQSFPAGPMAQALLDMLNRAERALEVDQIGRASCRERV